MTESAGSSPPKDQDIFGNELRLSGKYTTVDRARSGIDVGTWSVDRGLVRHTRVAISCRRDHIQASVRVCGVASLLDNKGVEDRIN